MGVPTANKDRLPCPKCGENWMFGWEKPSLLKDFLAEKSQLRCAKCKTVFPIRFLNGQEAEG